MNLRKIKLALIVKLLNNADVKYPLSQVKKLLRGFKTDLGNFLSIDLLSKSRLNNSLEQETFELKYEKMTINLELVRNSNTHATIIKDFIMK